MAILCNYNFLGWFLGEARFFSGDITPFLHHRRPTWHNDGEAQSTNAHLTMLHREQIHSVWYCTHNKGGMNRGAVSVTQ